MVVRPSSRRSNASAEAAGSPSSHTARRHMQDHQGSTASLHETHSTPSRGTRSHASTQRAATQDGKPSTPRRERPTTRSTRWGQVGGNSVTPASCSASAQAQDSAALVAGTETSEAIELFVSETEPTTNGSKHVPQQTTRGPSNTESIPLFGDRVTLAHRLLARETGGKAPSALQSRRLLNHPTRTSIMMEPRFVRPPKETSNRTIPGLKADRSANVLLHEAQEMDRRTDGNSLVREMLGINDCISKDTPKLDHIWDNPHLVSGQHIRSGQSDYSQRRRMHIDLTPRISVADVKIGGIPRKFSPDGKYLIAFGHNMHAVQVYYYKGPKIPRYLVPEVDTTLDAISQRQQSQAIDMESRENSQVDSSLEPLLGASEVQNGGIGSMREVQEATGLPSANIFGFNNSAVDGRVDARSAAGMANFLRRETLFSEMFDLKYETSLCSGGKWLCRDFCVFISDFELTPSLYEQFQTADGKPSATHEVKFMILASAKPASTLETGENVNVDFITLWSVDIHTGKVVSSFELPNDFIYLTNQSGVHCYGNILCVTSVQSQSIYMFNIDTSTGEIRKIKTIGGAADDEDEFCLQNMISTETRFRKKLEDTIVDKLSDKLAFIIAKHAFIGRNLISAIVGEDDVFAAPEKHEIKHTVYASNSGLPSFGRSSEDDVLEAIDSDLSYVMKSMTKSMPVVDGDFTTKDSEELCIPSASPQGCITPDIDIRRHDVPKSVKRRSSNAKYSSRTAKFASNLEGEDEHDTDTSSVDVFDTASEGSVQTKQYSFATSDFFVDNFDSGLEGYEEFSNMVDAALKTGNGIHDAPKYVSKRISNDDARRYRNTRVEDAICSSFKLNQIPEAVIPPDVAYAKVESSNKNIFPTVNDILNMPLPENVKNTTITSNGWYDDVIRYCRTYGKYAFRSMLDEKLPDLLSSKLCKRYGWFGDLLKTEHLDAAWISIVASVLHSRRNVLKNYYEPLKGRYDGSDMSVLREIADLHKGCLAVVGVLQDIRELMHDNAPLTEALRVERDTQVLVRVVRALVGSGSMEEISSIGIQNPSPESTPIGDNASNVKVRENVASNSGSHYVSSTQTTYVGAVNVADTNSSSRFCPDTLTMAPSRKRCRPVDSDEDDFKDSLSDANQNGMEEDRCEGPSSRHKRARLGDTGSYRLPRRSARKLKSAPVFQKKVDVEQILNDSVAQFNTKYRKQTGVDCSQLDIDFDALFIYDNIDDVRLQSENKFNLNGVWNIPDLPLLQPPLFKDSQYDTEEHRRVFIPTTMLRLASIALDGMSIKIEASSKDNHKRSGGVRNTQQSPPLFGSVAPRFGRNGLRAKVSRDSEASSGNSAPQVPEAEAVPKKETVSEKTPKPLAKALWMCSQRMVSMHLISCSGTIGAASSAAKMSQMNGLFTFKEKISDHPGSLYLDMQRISSTGDTESRASDAINGSQAEAMNPNGARPEDSYEAHGNNYFADHLSASNTFTNLDSRISQDIISTISEIGQNSTVLKEESLFFGLGWDLFPGIIEPVESSVEANNVFTSFASFNSNTRFFPWNLLKSLVEHLPSERSCHIIPGLKRKILTYLYRRALEADISDDVDRPRNKFGRLSTVALRNFNSSVPHMEQLSMWRCHFLNENHLLIKLGSKTNVFGRMSEGSYASNLIYFIIYSLKTSEVIGVFDNMSDEFLMLYLKSPQLAGVKSLRNHSQNTLSVPCNSQFAMESVLKQINIGIKPRNGGPISAIRRTLSHLPLNEQCIYESPYLDMDLFTYDDRHVTTSDRARIPPDQAMKFFSRVDGGLSFNLVHNGNFRRHEQRSQKRPVNWIFHPTDPFVIGVTNNDISNDVVIHGI